MSDSTSTHPPPTLPARYAVVRHIGSGASGQVWLVNDRASEPAQKAMKVLRADLPGVLVQSFKEEFRILASLDHPGLARVYDFGELGDGRAFYTAELVEGDELVARCGPDLRDACLAIAAVCRSLAYIHARGYVHNDVKPANVLVGASPESAKLLDFGLSGLARTRSRTVSGTPGYIAPERLEGASWDARADLYAIGATLYRVIGGRRVTTTEDPGRALAELRSGWPPLSDLRADVPPALSVLVQRLLALEPSARPRHAFEVIAELGKILGEVLPLETMGSARCYALSSIVVGREGVLADIERVVRDALAGGSKKLVAIAGRPGLGKTRLAREIAWRMDAGVAVASTRCADHEAGLEPLHRAAALLAAAAADATEDALTDALLARARASRRGALLIVDDVHLASEAAWRALVALARSAREARVPLAIVLTLNPDELPTSSRQRLALASASGELARIELGPLAASELQHMLASLFGTAVIPKAVEDAIAERSGGNPLLLEEIVRDLVESGAVRSTIEGWKASEAQPRLASRSARLEDYLRRRCAALPADALTTLAAIGALGTRADLVAIAAVAGDGVDVELGVALAAERGLVSIRDGAAMLEQDALRGVVSALIDGDVRVRVARAAVAWLAAHGADDLQLSRAHREAGDASAAFDHALRSGERALASAEGSAALRALTDARAAAEEARPSRERRAALASAYAAACELVGKPSEALEAFAEAFELFAADAFADRLRAATGAVMNALFAGRAADAEEWLARAREATPPGEKLAAAWLAYASALVDLGLRAGGEAARAHLVAALDRLREADDTADVRALRARVLTAFTANEATFHVARAEQAARDAAAAADAAGLRYYAYASINNLAHAQLLQNDVSSARGSLAEVARVLERSGNLARLVHVIGNLVFLDVLAGDWTRAREHLDRLAALTDDVFVATRVHACEALRLAWWQGDAVAARRAFARLRASSGAAHNLLVQWLPFGVASASDGAAARALAAEAERIVGDGHAPGLRALAALARAYAIAYDDPRAGAAALEAAAGALADAGHRDKRAVVLRDAGDAFARANDGAAARRCYERAREVHASVGCADGLAQIAARIDALDAPATGRVPAIDDVRSITDVEGALAQLARSAGLRCEVRLDVDGAEREGARRYSVRFGPTELTLAIMPAEGDSDVALDLLAHVARATLRALHAELDAAPLPDADRPPTGATSRPEQEESRLLELTIGPAELRHDFGGVVGRSAPIMRALALLDRLADEEAPVLLTGETGTGKEVFARALHAASRRARAPFVVVNCAAVPSQLFEAELFGHRRGAFTGATRDHAGYAREADGGVLFLDEIGELPLELQPKLLRLIQEKRVRPVGGDVERPVDVRLVAATHRTLQDDVDAGRFRADLFYRLNVVEVRLPALRDRPTDIAPLARFFLERIGRADQRITPKAMRRLARYAWPGNVRELENELHRASILAADGPIESRHLSARVRAEPDVALPASGTLAERLAVLEREVVARALTEAHGNRTKAARALGVTRQGLAIKLRRLGIEPGSKDG